MTAVRKVVTDTAQGLSLGRQAGRQASMKVQKVTRV